jgi:hypothetical protein
VTRVDLVDVERARVDPCIFAELLIGEPLWHQRAVVLSRARIRAICSGRQAGKSRTLAVLALWDAFRAPGRRVLVVSAGEAASKDLLSHCALLVSSPLLAGSTTDESVSSITLSNGSTIQSVPASSRQVRGKTIDLLILDEACFIPAEVWAASQYTVISRSGSKVVLASTPFGRSDSFFSVLYRAGERGEEDVESFHWPSTASPMVDPALLDLWQRTSTDREYRREVLAEWVDDEGAFFTTAELDGNVDDYELLRPEEADGLVGVGGIDWAFAQDASAVTIVAVDEFESSTYGDVFFVPWVEEAFAAPYATFIDHLVEVVGPGRYALDAFVGEANGVGAMPCQELARRLGRRMPVHAVHTTAQSKEDAFGAIKLLLQQQRLILPRHPALLAQLSALEFVQRESGLTSIGVPERRGHDDLAMSLALAMHPAGRLVAPKPAGLRFRSMV